MNYSITACPGGGAIGYGRLSEVEAVALAKKLVSDGFRDVVVTNLATKAIVWQQAPASTALVD